ncbi:FAD-binding protein [Colwelliaceae bacterium 6441]
MDRRRFLTLSAITLTVAGCGGGSDSSPAPVITTPPVNSTISDALWQQLSGDLNGNLILPNAGNIYENARVVFNTRFDHIYPQAIVHCANEADIKTALSFVQEHKLHVTSRCGSHGYAGYSTTTGLVIDVTPMSEITIDDGTVTIGSGARLVDVYDQLSEQGVAIPLGSCLSVGISGLTQGGGIGVVDRAYGLTCDSLLSAKVILADGTEVICSEAVEPDLFWAIRGGGGGNFGVVSSFTFKTHPTKDITVFSASYALDDFADVMTHWQTISESWPNEMWGQVIPDWTNLANPTILIRAFCVNSVEQAQPYWDDFIDNINATPFYNKSATNSYRNTMLGNCENTVPACHISNQFPEGTMRRSAFAASSDYFDDVIPLSGLEELSDYIQSSINESNRGMIIINTMGGVIKDFAPNETAFVHRNAIISAEYYTYLSTNDATAIDNAQTWLNSFRNIMKPWSSGGAYVNYIDPLITNWQEAYYGENYARLQEIKKHYDPNKVFSMPQGIEPA